MKLSHQKCVSNFVIYQKRIKDKGRTLIKTMWGIPAKERGFIHEPME